MRCLAVLVSMVVVASCAAAPKAAAEAMTQVTASGPPIAFQGVRLSAYNGSTRTWVLLARKVGYAAPKASLEQMRLDSYYQGRRISVAEAPSAALDAHLGVLTMRGPVQVHSTVNQAAFSADAMTWNASSQRLSAEGHVVFHRGVSRLAGARLEADNQLKQVRISGPVSATVSVPVPEFGKSVRAR